VTLVDTTPAVLELVGSLARDCSEADERLALGLVVARAAGRSLEEIAAAANLSTSRASEIITRHGGPVPASPGRVLSRAEAAKLLRGALSIVIVPAGKLALGDYQDHSAYICNPYRSFRPGTNRFGFYAHGEISPWFPSIRASWESVPFTPEEVAQRREQGDTELAELIERILAKPGRGGHRPGAHKVVLLTPPEHDGTIRIAHPIRHLERGRGRAFVRRQRYTSEAAVEREPHTTAELLQFERE
jgi:hypothetical protein